MRSLTYGPRAAHRALWAAAILLLTLSGAAAQLVGPPPPVPPPTIKVPAAPETPATPAPANEPGGFFSFFDPRTSPFIPIPEIGTDPNSGTTVGILPVFLTTDKQGNVSRILAPDFIYNPDLGFGADYRLLAYPSSDTQWSIVGGVKQRIERGLDGFYSTGITRQADWSTFYRAAYDRSATDRFFGLGNNSQHANQTSYTNEQEYLNFRFGRNFGPNFQIALDMRPRVIEIEHGAFGSLPSTSTVFPGLAGLGNSNEFLNRIFITWDTRDSTSIPTTGSEIVAFAGATDRSFLSSVSYTLFGLDARRFVPIGDRFTLAGHAALRYMPSGGNPPFWAQSSLGGDRSVLAEQQPLRAFGGDRFIDLNSFSSSVELRTKIFELNLFSTTVTFEMAPFVDAGRVFHNLGDNPVDHLHVAGGMGFRGVAKPYVVGYVDVGFGSEGLAIFSGIDYPF